jgi:hypothetical protein
MAGKAKKALVLALALFVSIILILEVGFCAGGWFWALKVKGGVHWMVPIMAVLLATGWVPLLLNKYSRKTLLFQLLVMTSAFAVMGAVMSMLIVTGDRPRLLKPLGIMTVSWIAGGLWGWVITYLDRQKWRMGERLDEFALGRGPIEDAKFKRPLTVVCAVIVLAAATTVLTWGATKEKLFRDLWSKEGYVGRMWILEQRVPISMFYGKTQKQLEGYFGKEYRKAGQPERLAWLIGTAPVEDGDNTAAKQGWLSFKMIDGRAVAGWIEYERSGEPWQTGLEGSGNAH